MKFISTLTIALSITLSVVQAQTLVFSRPAAGAMWVAGSDETLVWTGDCSHLGVLSHVVPLQLYDNGFPDNSKDLGHLDCSSNTTTSKQIKIPANVGTGSAYSIRALTLPEVSSSDTFQIDAPNPSNSASSSPSPSSLPSTGTKANEGGHVEIFLVTQIVSAGAVLCAVLLTF